MTTPGEVVSGITVSDTITRPADTNVYTALDALSDATGDAHFTFQTPGGAGHLVFPNGNMQGTIKNARLHSDAAPGTLIDADLYLFHTDIATIADNAAFTVTDAEALTLLAIIEFDTFKDLDVGNSAQSITGLDIPISLINPTRLYGQLVVQNAYTPVSGEIFTCDIEIERRGF